MAAIGIDLGTTNSCISIIKDGKPIIIPNSLNERTTPSYIGFYKNKIIFGDAAKKVIFINIENTVFDLKRIIGRDFADPFVQLDIMKWKFHVENCDGQPKIPITFKNNVKYYSAEEINALFLKELKKTAENYLKQTVTTVVITVPAHFNNSQRQATIDAGKIAGFNQIKLLNEPTAAAIAYALDKTSNYQRTALIFDLGGGTFDVSIVAFKNDNIEVLAIDGDPRLGGGDIDNILFNHFKAIIDQTISPDALLKPRIFYRLKNACEDAKRALSFSSEYCIELDNFHEDEDFCYTLTLKEFDQLNKYIYSRALNVVQNCLTTANLKTEEIDDVVLIGGSTKIINFRKLLESKFGKSPKSSINPDEAVAMGAAIEAARWNDTKSVKNIKFQDITPWSLGLETAGGFMSVIIPKHSKIPIEITKYYLTTYDYQTCFDIKIYYGNEDHTKDNKFLGDLNITGIKPGLSKAEKIAVTFSVREDGILNVAAKSSEGEYVVKISLNKGKLTEADVRIKQDELQEVFNQDEAVTKLMGLKNDLESLANDIILDFKTNPELMELCREAINWLKSVEILNADEIEKKIASILKLKNN